MKVLLIDNGTSLLDKLQNLIPGVEVTKKWNDISGLNITKFNFIILSGIGNGISFGGDVTLATLAVGKDEAEAQRVAEKGLKPLTQQRQSEGQYTDIAFVRAEALSMKKASYIGLLQV